MSDIAWTEEDREWARGILASANAGQPIIQGSESGNYISQRVAEEAVLAGRAVGQSVGYHKGRLDLKAQIFGKESA